MKSAARGVSRTHTGRAGAGGAEKGGEAEAAVAKGEGGAGEAAASSAKNTIRCLHTWNLTRPSCGVAAWSALASNWL